MTTIPGNTSTTAVLTGTGVFTSSLEFSGDSDWWRVNTVAGRTYDFTLSGDGSATSLDDAYMTLRDSSGNQISYTTVYNGQARTLSFTATSAGPYYIDISDASSDDDAEGSYRIVTRMNDILPNNGTTTATLVNGTVAGNLEASGDSDWYRVTLKAGQSVDFLLSGDGSATSLDDAYLVLRDGAGNQISYTTVYNGSAQRLTYTATQTGTYYIEVSDASSDDAPEGSFRLTSRLSDNVPNNGSTTQILRDGSVLNGVIDASRDVDWVKFETVAGRTYTLRLTGDGTAGGMTDQYVGLLDNNGTRLDYDYAYGAGYATLTFTATRTGLYYIEAAGNDSGDWGRYKLSVISDSPLLRGTTGADSLTGGANNTRIVGLGGNDTLNGGAGNDRLLGGFGNDVLLGDVGIDTADYDGSIAVRVSLAVTGPQATGHGTDILRGIENLAGGQLGDWLMGNGAANVLEGRGGNDTLNGGAGNDRLFGGAGDDQLAGGEGVDAVVYTAAGAVVVDLTTGRASGAEGNDTLAGVEQVFTGAGNDVLRGNVLANLLNGGAGNDVLEGRAGNDSLYGGAGNDNLTGGAGNDRLFGGAGADRFIFGKGDGGDVIADFQDGTDRIVMTTAADSMADLRITAGANGAVVWFDGGNVVLTNIAVNQLSAADFIFA